MDEYSQLLESVKGADKVEPIAKAVCVVWEDIWDHPDTWLDYPLDEEDIQPLHMRTIGYLVQSTDKVVVIAGTLDLKNNSLGQVCVLPKGCIRSLTLL